MRLRRLESKLQINLKKPVTAGTKSKQRVNEPVIFFLRPEFVIKRSEGVN
jgi:hypothetical protein